jgi:hypothetical protein
MTNRITPLRGVAGALGLAAVLAAAPALMAEEGQPKPTESQKSVLVSDEKLDQFVDAMTDVIAIRDEVSAELEATEDTAEAQQLQRDAQVRMIEAVENSGLTLEEYNQIAAMMGSDPELQEKINSKVQESS